MLPGAVAFLVLGLVGSVHCAGMCGGFALGVAMASGPARSRLLLDQLAFVFGKALTYVVLGLALRTTLAATIDAAGISGLQRALSIAAGVVLVLGGLKLLGIGLPRASGPFVRRFIGGFARAQSAARYLGGTTGALGAGVLTGFLPCGLSWSAFALATQVDALVAAPGLFLFGLGTSPALVLTALGGRRLALLTAHRRLRGAQLAGAALIAFGVVTALRGGWTYQDALAGTPAPCCESGDSGSEHAEH